MSRHRIETSERAVKLTAEGDNNDWRADGTDLQHVVVNAVDSKGRRDYSASTSLTFNVSGPAEIVGVVNGDINSEELTVGNTRRLFNGAAMVILRSKPEAGDVKLKVTSDVYKTLTLKLETK